MAVSLHCIDRDDARAAKSIHASGDRLKVPRMNAERVSTEVIDLKSNWDQFYEVLVRPTMHECVLSLV